MYIISDMFINLNVRINQWLIQRYQIKVVRLLNPGRKESSPDVSHNCPDLVTPMVLCKPVTKVSHLRSFGREFKSDGSIRCKWVWCTSCIHSQDLQNEIGWGANAETEKYVHTRDNMKTNRWHNHSNFLWPLRLMIITVALDCCHK